MTTLRRLTLVSTLLALTALLTSTQVWGESGKKTKDQPLARPETPPAQAERLADDLAQTKFAKQPVVTYQTQDGGTLFGLQVKPKLDAGAARPRDVLILVDTSASQIRAPLATARKIADSVAAAAGADDRIAVWTVNIPAATRNLTNGFKSPKSPAVQDALAALKLEVPFGATDLKNALQKAVASFEMKEGRQRVVLFLGNGMSIHNPIDGKERSQLCEKLVASEVAFFPVPLGPRTQLERGSPNLHGFATGTGGLVVRCNADEDTAETAKRLNEAFAAPILYTKKFQMPAEAKEFYPTKLPPLRTDAPTLVLGKIKPGATLTYTVEGTVAGKSVKVKMTEVVSAPELDNFFLSSLFAQWSRAADHDMPALIRADRAMALAFEQNRLIRDDLLAQAQWAMAQDNFGAAEELFARAKQIDPNDDEADAGMKIVEKLRKGLLNRKALRDALAKPDHQAIRIEKGKLVRGKLGDLVAQADPKADPKADKPDAAPAPDAPVAGREDLLRQEKARLAVEEQRITGVVADAERRARQLINTDPDGAIDLLKRTLASVRDNADLGNQTRQNLIARLDTALRTAATQGARIKQDIDQRLRALADANRRFALEAERERGDELIRRKVLAFNGLMNQGRFEEAYKEALRMQQESLDRGAPIPPVFTAGYSMGQNASFLRESNEIRRAKEERALLTWLQVDKSAIPFPDEPPVQFPPAAVWRALTERRKGVWDFAGLAEDDPAGLRPANKIKSILDKPLDFPDGIPANTTLKDALDTIYDMLAKRGTPVTFVIDTNAFQGINVQKAEEQQVQLQKMVGVSLSTVLRLLLGQIKGDKYIGTYLIRRDYVEITTTFHAAAEKTTRAYPAADLVIPIPNAVNIQQVTQSLNFYGQFQQAANPFPPNPFGGLNPFNPAAAAPPQGQFNAFQFQGQQPGFNQFGNLGGQFGFQGGDQSYELMHLITRVVAPGEWSPLGTNPNQPNPANAALQANPAEDMGPSVDPPLRNGIDYYQPARSLIVRGSSRIHTRAGGGLVGVNPGGPPAMGALDRNPGGALVIGPKPKDVKDPKVQIAGDQDIRNKPKTEPKKPAVEVADVDAKKVWEDALAKVLKNPKADHTGLVIACADFLVQNGKFDHAAEFLKAELRLGIVSRPWVYEALALSLQLSGGSADEIERAQVSAIDVEPTDAQGYLRAAKAMVELKRPDRAVALCRQAALMQPNAPDAYANALVYAEVGKDGDAMTWAAGNLLRRDWPLDNDFLHDQARQGLAELTKVLQKDRKAEVERMLAATNEVKVRDLVVQLTWQCEPGDVDLDLKVKEPIGTTCSFLTRQTPGGGTLLGDGIGDGSRETYVASEAFTGDYEITVDRVRGRPLGNKATVEIIRFQGTPNEKRERHTVSFDSKGQAPVIKFALANGRRTTVAVVPEVAPRAERVVDDLAGTDRVLNKLRSMTDPLLRDGGFRGGVTGMGTHIRTAPAAPAVKPADVQVKVSSPTTGGADLMAQQVIDPKTGRPGVKLNPVFQTLQKAQPPAPANPLVPGGN